MMEVGVIILTPKQLENMEGLSFLNSYIRDPELVEFHKKEKRKRRLYYQFKIEDFFIRIRLKWKKILKRNK